MYLLINFTLKLWDFVHVWKSMNSEEILNLHQNLCQYSIAFLKDGTQWDQFQHVMLGEMLSILEMRCYPLDFGLFGWLGLCYFLFLLQLLEPLFNGEVWRHCEIMLEGRINWWVGVWLFGCSWQRPR